MQIPSEVIDIIVEYWDGAGAHRGNPIIIEEDKMDIVYARLPTSRASRRPGEPPLYFGLLTSGRYGTAYFSEFNEGWFMTPPPRAAHQAMIATYRRHGADLARSGYQIVEATDEEEEHLRHLSVFEGL